MTIPMPEPVAWAHFTKDGLIQIWSRKKTDVESMERLMGKRPDDLITTSQAEAYADARVREAQQWQPIETAPKDGSRVILAWGGKSMSGFFLDNSNSPMPWAGWRTESMVPMPAGQPSHWMPLPAPPHQ